jgi:thymidylate synthase ThyX
MRLKYPLIVHAEMCRHRCFSRSVASNRAIPTSKIVSMVQDDLFIPIYWGTNQPGMQAGKELDDASKKAARRRWRDAADAAVGHAEYLNALGVHKQIANRVLGPYQWVTEIITGTDYDNFYALRLDKGAQPEVRKIAEMMHATTQASEPETLNPGMWHIPFLTPNDKEGILAGRINTFDALRISAARCARTSYRTHEGKISSFEEDIALYNRLMGQSPLHASPTEHQAMARNSETEGVLIPTYDPSQPWTMVEEPTARRRQQVYYANLQGFMSFRLFHYSHTIDRYQP